MLAALFLARKGRGLPERFVWAWQCCAGCMALQQPWAPPPRKQWSGQPFFTQGTSTDVSYGENSFGSPESKA